MFGLFLGFQWFTPTSIAYGGGGGAYISDTASRSARPGIDWKPATKEKNRPGVLQELIEI